MEHKYSTWFLFGIIGVAVMIGLVSGIEGVGTKNSLAKFLGNDLIGNSSIIDDGISVNVSQPIYIQGSKAVTENGNNVFTGNNNHTGTELFSGSVTIFNLNITSVEKVINGTIELKNGLGNTTILLDADSSSYFNNGNVGIGASSPTTILEVQDISPIITLRGENVNNRNGTIEFKTVGSGAYAGIQFSRDVSPLSHIGFFTRNATSSYAERIRIDALGNLGIGTTTPDYLLDVEGDGDIRVVGTARTDGIVLGHTTLGNYDIDNLGTGVFRLVNRGGGLQLQSGTSSDSIIFYTGNTTTERARINQNGNVGIGTTSPQAKLDVNDTTIRFRASDNSSQGMCLNATSAGVLSAYKC